MNLSLNRKVEKLDAEAKKALKQKVYDIYMKYGNNGDQVSAQASDYEKQVLMRYYYPKALERFRRYLPVFFPEIMTILFTHELYPMLYKVQLSEARTDDDLFLLEHYLDRLYDTTVNPTLNCAFWTEVLESLERDDDTLPVSDVVTRWRDAQRERDELKEQSYLIAVDAVKRDAAHEAESMRLHALERDNDQVIV